MVDHASRYVSPLIQFGPEDCAALTRFDNAMTGDFYRIDDDVYPKLFDFGARVRGHLDAEGNIISIGALYPERLNHPSFHRLQREMPDWAAFADAAAVDPKYRHTLPGDRRLHREHFGWRIKDAEELRKEVLLSTTRDDNIPCSRNMHAMGFYGIGHTPDLAPRNHPRWRKVMALLLGMPNPFAKKPEAAKPRVELEVRHNQATPAYSKRVAELLLADYVEYSCTDAKGADPQDPARLCIARFGRIASLPGFDDVAQEALTVFKREIQMLAKER